MLRSCGGALCRCGDYDEWIAADCSTDVKRLSASASIRAIDADGLHGNAVAARVVDERLNGIEAHRLRADEAGKVVRRIVKAQPDALKGGACEGGGVRLGEAE